jgi:hypothetical protein
MAFEGEKANIPLGEIGLLTDIAPDKIPPNALIKANNVVMTKGTVEKAPGSYRWNASALDSGIIALHDWRPDTITKRMIAVTDSGNIYKGRDREFGSAINTGLGSLTPNCQFEEGGNETAGNPRKLFLITAGRTNPYVLSGDGSTFAEIDSPNSDWTNTNRPNCGVTHRNRLWVFAGQIAYASDTADHENFQTNNLTEPVYPGEGGEIKGAFIYKGKLLVFKEGGFAYILNDTDTTSANWYWQKLSNNFGLAAPNALEEVLDNLYTGNTTGTITDYAASDKLGSISAGDLIQNAQFESHLRANTSKTGIPEQHLLYYPEKKILFATYRSTYKTYNDMMVVLDFSRINAVRASYWIKGTPQCLAHFKDNNNILRPMYGDKDGYVNIMDYEDRKEGESAYTGEFQIPHINFSHMDPRVGSMEKHFSAIADEYIPESTGDLKCDYFIDGRYIETISLSMLQYQESKLDSLTLDTDRLKQANTETSLGRLFGSGRTFSARLYNSGSNESFQIASITVYFRLGGDKAQQQGGS